MKRFLQTLGDTKQERLETVAILLAILYMAVSTALQILGQTNALD